LAGQVSRNFVVGVRNKTIGEFVDWGHQLGGKVPTVGDGSGGCALYVLALLVHVALDGGQQFGQVFPDKFCCQRTGHLAKRLWLMACSHVEGTGYLHAACRNQTCLTRLGVWYAQLTECWACMRKPW
jgi:hypothetical protein